MEFVGFETPCCQLLVTYFDLRWVTIRTIAKFSNYFCAAALCETLDPAPQQKLTWLPLGGRSTRTCNAGPQLRTHDDFEDLVSDLADRSSVHADDVDALFAQWG